MIWQWHQLDHVQIICTSLQPASYHTTFLQAECSSWRPTNSVKALKASHNSPQYLPARFHWNYLSLKTENFNDRSCTQMEKLFTVERPIRQWISQSTSAQTCHNKTNLTTSTSFSSKIFSRSWGTNSLKPFMNAAIWCRMRSLKRHFITSLRRQRNNLQLSAFTVCIHEEYCQVSLQ